MKKLYDCRNKVAISYAMIGMEEPTTNNASFLHGQYNASVILGASFNFLKRTQVGREYFGRLCVFPHQRKSIQLIDKVIGGILEAKSRHIKAMQGDMTAVISAMNQ